MENEIAATDQDDNPSMDVFKIPSTCPSCQEVTNTNICQIDIPHFKQVLLMTLTCDCGYRSTETKPVGDIASHGTKTTLQIQSKEDLNREVVWSDTAGVAIPEIELQVEQGMDGGVYTTVEGLIQRLLRQLTVSNPFLEGEEGSSNPMMGKYQDVLTKLEDIGNGSALPATLIIDDPLSNSFIGPRPIGNGEIANLGEQGHNDNQLETEVYERSFSQNEALGLNQLDADDAC